MTWINKIEDIDISPQDFLMVEMKFNNYWPRDQREEEEEEDKDWRDFEVGDKVDVKKENQWKVGQVKKVLKNGNKILVHYVHEQYFKDEKISIKSARLDKFGTHTLEQMFKDSNDSEVIVPGIRNLGNTCYMNAILQCLIYTPLFKEFFEKDGYEKFLHPKSSSLVTALSTLMKDTDKKIIKPSYLKKAVNKELTLFYGFDQWDAQEFLIFFFNQIAEDLRRFTHYDETETNKDDEDNKDDNEQQAGKEVESNKVSEDEKKEDDGDNDSEKSDDIIADEGKHGSTIKINKPKVMDESDIQPSNHKGRDSFIPSSTPEARKAWEKECKELDSPIKDLFAGQTACTVTCGNWNNKTVTYELFYTLSLPLPLIDELIIYCYFINRIDPETMDWWILYGLKLKKKSTTLNDLLEKLSKITSIDADRLVLAEINGNKYVKIISAHKKNKDMKLMNIGLRSNRIFAYEVLDTSKYANRLVKQPKFNPNEQSDNRHKYYRSIQDLQTFMIVDAQDYRGDWYRGITMGIKVTKHEDLSMKVHFIEFDEKWDEFYDDENLYKIAPPGTYAEEPNVKDHTFIAYHRVNQTAFEGVPMIITFSSEMTWEEAYREIVTQVSRMVSIRYYKRFSKGSKLKSTFRLDYLEELIEEPPFSVIFVEATGRKCLFCSLEAKTCLSRDKERK